MLMNPEEYNDETNGGAPAVLKPRYEKFVEGYVTNGGNATRAAEYAGYDQSPKSLKAHASWLLKKPEIVKRIRQRMLEGARIHTDEILGVLANRMRGNIMDVIDENGQVDLEAIRALELGHLVRKVTIVRKQLAVPGDTQTRERPELQTMKIELHADPGAANHLAKILRDDDTKARRKIYKRFLFKACDELVEFDDDLSKTEPGLSPDEVFERFADAVSPHYGFDLRVYKHDIMKEVNIGSPQAGTPGQTVAAREPAA